MKTTTPTDDQLKATYRHQGFREVRDTAVRHVISVAHGNPTGAGLKFNPDKADRVRQYYYDVIDSDEFLDIVVPQLWEHRSFRESVTAGDRSGVAASMSNQLKDSLLVWAYSHRNDTQNIT